MPNDLSRDCSSCVDLYNHVRHFEWRPVLVLNQITNQPNVVFIRLTGWIAYSCAVDKSLFGIWSYRDKFATRRGAQRFDPSHSFYRARRICTILDNQVSLTQALVQASS